MTSLLLATRNAHKTREFRKLLGPNFEVTDLSSFPEMALPGESGRSFEENSRLKALSISQPLVGTSRCDVRRAQRTVPTFVVADDSGLEVDALRGAPGIFSARYAGQNATDKENVEKLLQELGRIQAHELSQRTARFRCVLAVAREGKVLGVFSGTVDGTIVDLPRGSSGFGYDPVFRPKEFDRTFGELPAEVKNRISHRARAVRAFCSAFESIVANQGLGGGGGAGAPGG
jgi:XTP/dITP diphosphohydrolase